MVHRVCNRGGNDNGDIRNLMSSMNPLDDVSESDRVDMVHEVIGVSGTYINS